ncbi:uncharacterized protein ACLA_018470 [Aspergillus clavatus NRRL 1]|uniref:Uncharacterized protein n=1 Tax=Aspergillus clavatus (strain ATCC 1007 / CBS 513.65 / DSM 816 / NCTC 3887 / NRRL 1 / QM 1276 / 107) TaxID=344612 RepID=A1CNC2_ASPCL|nr:uncharacterized protein ACLA_018470 [Aspergillus clavatus NRRL 1]EAW07143.1 hypothetical protein ACLA_018470 [Aspergillus clavatus NRRL 1]
MLKEHVDAEQAVFLLADKGTALDAQSWPALMKQTRGHGDYIDVKVVLKERSNVRDKLNAMYSGKDKYFAQPWDSTWIKAPKRASIVDVLNAYNLPWETDEVNMNPILVRFDGSFF